MSRTSTAPQCTASAVRGLKRRADGDSDAAPPSRGIDVLSDELAAEDFPDQALRQLGAELDRRRHLERRERLAAMLAQFVFGDLLSGAQHDPGLDGFAFQRVPHSG